MLAGQRRKNTYIAKTWVETLSLAKDDLLKIFGKNPRAARRLINIVLQDYRTKERLQELSRKLLLGMVKKEQHPDLWAALFIQGVWNRLYRQTIAKPLVPDEEPESRRELVSAAVVPAAAPAEEAVEATVAATAAATPKASPLGPSPTLIVPTIISPLDLPNGKADQLIAMPSETGSFNDGSGSRHGGSSPLAARSGSSLQAPPSFAEALKLAEARVMRRVRTEFNYLRQDLNIAAEPALTNAYLDGSAHGPKPQLAMSSRLPSEDRSPADSPKQSRPASGDRKRRSLVAMVVKPGASRVATTTPRADNGAPELERDMLL